MGHRSETKSYPCSSVARYTIAALANSSDGKALGGVRQRQANIRLDDATYERLEIAAFIDRQSVPDALRGAVLAWLDSFDEADIEAAKRLRKSNASKQADPAPVSSLAKKRRARSRNE